MCVSISPPITYNLNCCNYKIDLDMNRLIISTLSFFFKFILVILVHLPSHIHFRIILSTSTWNFPEILIGIVLTSMLIWGELTSFYAESSNS